MKSTFIHAFMLKPQRTAFLMPHFSCNNAGAKPRHYARQQIKPTQSYRRRKILKKQERSLRWKEIASRA